MAMGMSRMVLGDLVRARHELQRAVEIDQFALPLRPPSLFSDVDGRISATTFLHDCLLLSGYLYSKVSGYKEFSRAALREMFRQTGDELVFDENGLLQRGLVVRLLVLPNDIGSISESIEWIRDELSPRVAISLMAQYYPTHQAETNKRYVLLSRRIRESEWMKATTALETLGMEEGWVQEFDGASYYYRPDFNNPDTPFTDIRDFE